MAIRVALAVALLSSLLSRPALGQGCEQAARWTLAPTVPNFRARFASAWDSYRDRLVVYGGVNGSLLSDTWEWDGASWLLRSTPVSPTGLEDPAMVYDAARRRVVLFGRNVSVSPSRAETWEWDGHDWVLRTPASGPPSRTQHMMAYDAARERVVLFGGFTGNVLLGDTWEWDGTDWTQRIVTAGPNARSLAGMVYDPVRRRTVLFGGAGAPSDTWEWDGGAWTLASASSAIGVLDRFALAFDPSSQRVMLFGGRQSSGTLRAETWAWDGTAWTLRAPASPSGPNARSSHGLVTDPVRGRVLAIGGQGAQDFEQDMWEWGGQAWTLKYRFPSPSPRHRHAMAFDEGRGRAVLTGGLRPNFQLSRETWEWDGLSWVLRTPSTSLPAIEKQSMAYDAARSRMVLFGGATNTASSIDQTWEWDGADWTLRNTTPRPSPRTGPALVYDRVRQRIVLHGGGSSGWNVSFQDTWEWDGSVWNLASSDPRMLASFVPVVFDPARGRVLLFRNTGNPGVWTWNAPTWSTESGISFPGSTVWARYSSVVFDPTRARLVAFVSELQPTPGMKASEWRSWFWQQSLAAPRPHYRSDYALAMDGARGYAVLFGGLSTSNNYGTVSSDTWLYGAPPVSIMRQPISRVVTTGGYAELSVIAHGGAGLSYSWRRNGVDLSDGAAMLGSERDVLHLRGLGTSDVGVYTCVVTDTCGVSVESAAATVTTCRADFNADAVWTIDDILTFLSAWFADDRRADVDGDGVRRIDDIFAFLTLWFAGCG